MTINLRVMEEKKTGIEISLGIRHICWMYSILIMIRL